MMRQTTYGSAPTAAHMTAATIEMPRRFLIVTKSPSGAAELTSMKEWLRNHPEQMPPDFVPQHKTSHQLRNELRRLGWVVNETEDEVRLMRPEIAEDSNIVSVLGEATSDTPLEQEEELAFSLEKHLRDFIAHNLTNLPISPRRLKLYVSSEQRAGIEFPTAVGLIDILAVDEQGNFVVFELKLTRGPDKAMGQLLRYMGWVKRNLAQGRGVYGVIVAKDIDEKLRYAALLVPNVSLLEYELDFRLKTADLTEGIVPR